MIQLNHFKKLIESNRNNSGMRLLMKILIGLNMFQLA